MSEAAGSRPVARTVSPSSALARLALAHPYLALMSLSLAVRAVTALAFSQPGYMDAYYNYVVAQSLYHGRGLTEDFIWNYLYVPTEVSHASNLYWMPLTALLVYASFLLLGESFLASQAPFILLSSALVLMAYYVGTGIFRDRRYAWIIALLTLFSAIFFPYWVIPDNVCPFAVTSLGALIFGYRALISGRWRHWALAGLFAGLSYLTRADGLLLLPAVVIATLGVVFSGSSWHSEAGPVRLGTKRAAGGLALMLAIFALAVSPWLVRNWLAAGVLLPPGASKAIFLREYNDIFTYARRLDLAYYLNLTTPSADWGLWPIALSKLSALASNLLLIGRPTFFALAPFFVVGMLVRRCSGGGTEHPLWRRVEYLPFLSYAAVLYLAMSLLFTFPSPRGSVMHSSGGILPFVFGAVVMGTDAVARWVSRRSRPKAEEARRTTYMLVILLVSVVLSAGFTARVSSSWDEHYTKYRAIGDWFVTRGLQDETIMIVDPPGYYYAAGQRSIVLSNDGIETDLELAGRYGARYIVLERARPSALTELYEAKLHPALRLRHQVEDAQIYEIQR